VIRPGTKHGTSILDYNDFMDFVRGMQKPANEMPTAPTIVTSVEGANN
jgi:hypothetical protein